MESREMSYDDIQKNADKMKQDQKRQEEYEEQKRLVLNRILTNEARERCKF